MAIRTRRIGTFLALGLMCAAPADANDSSMALIGGVPHVVDSPDVSMDGEVLVFTYVPFETVPAGDGACPDGFETGGDVCYREAHHAADLRYTFTNHGDAQTLQIGLPFDVPTFDEGDVVGPEGADPIVGLRTFVDEAEVAVERIDAVVQGVPWDANRTYLVTVPFDAGQTRVLRHTYKAHSGGSFGSGWFDYILRSGAGWRGPIGSIDIRFELPEPSPCVTASLPFERSGADIRVRMDNVEPETDFHVSWVQGTDVLVMLGLFADDEVAAERCTEDAFIDQPADALISMARHAELFYGAPHTAADASLLAEGPRVICGHTDSIAWALDADVDALSPAEQARLEQIRAFAYRPDPSWPAAMPSGVASCVAAMRAAAASMEQPTDVGPDQD